MTSKQRSSHSFSQVLNDFIHYFFATVLGQVMGLVRSILLPVLFLPAQLGFWNLANTIISYGANVHLGILHGMNKIIPSLRGQGKHQEIESVKDTVFWWNLYLSGIAMGLLLISSFFIPKVYMLYLCVVAAIIFLQQVFAFQFSLLRANNSFTFLSRGLVIFSVGSAVFILSLAYIFKDHVLGALVGLAIAYFLSIFYWFIRSRYKYSFKTNLSTLRQSFGKGFPILFITILDEVFLSIDRWIIVASFGVTVLGYYALGSMINNFFIMIPVSIANILYPKMLERYSGGKDFSSSNNLLLGALRISAIVMLLSICVISFGLPLLIKFFLPKYLPSISIIKILTLGVFFYSIAVITLNYLISVDKQRWLVYIQIVIIGLLVLSYNVILKLGYGINVFACVSTLGYSLFGLACIVSGVYLSGGKDSRKTFRFIAGLIVPFLIMTAFIIVTDLVMHRNWMPIEYVWFSVLSFLLTIGIVLPVAWFLNHDQGLEKILKNELWLLWVALSAKMPIGRRAG